MRRARSKLAERLPIDAATHARWSWERQLPIRRNVPYDIYVRAVSKPPAAYRCDIRSAAPGVDVLMRRNLERAGRRR